MVLVAVTLRNITSSTEKRFAAYTMPQEENEGFSATLPVFEASQGILRNIFLQIYYYRLQGILSMSFKRGKTFFLLNSSYQEKV